MYSKICISLNTTRTMIIHVRFLDLVQPDVDLCVPIYSVNVVLNLGIVTQHRNIIIHMIINVRNLIQSIS